LAKPRLRTVLLGMPACFAQVAPPSGLFQRPAPRVPA